MISFTVLSEKWTMSLHDWRAAMNHTNLATLRHIVLNLAKAGIGRMEFL